MADKKPAEQAEPNAAKSSEAPAADAAPEGKKKLGTVTLIVAALASFVVFLGVFSYMMGVFDPKPEATNQTATHDQATDSTLTGSGSQEFASPYGEAAAAIDAAEKANAIDTVAALTMLERRQRELAAQEREVERKTRELENLRAEVETLIDKKQSIDDEKTTYIARLIDGMKPDEMTGLMANLDNATILAVLPRMKPATASRVLSLLPPERAAKITTELLASEEVSKKP